MLHSEVKQSRRFIGPIIALVALALRSITAYAGHVALAWDPSASTTVTGYIVYMGQASGSYSTSFNAGNTTSYTISNLTDGATYYFAARAYDASGSQSAPSNELAVTLPAIPPTSTPPPPTVSYVITADFTVKNTTGRAPLAVAFTSTSTGTIASYSWNFGDGTTSTARGPSHTYAAAGTYSVSLQVIAPDGSQAGTTKPNLITVRPGTVTWKRSRR